MNNLFFSDDSGPIVRRNNCVFATHGTCYSVWVNVWYAGAYCGWTSGMQEHMLLHTRRSPTQNNKYHVSQKHSCLSCWWDNSRPKHVEIDKYIRNKFVHQVVLFTRLYRDARSTKHKIYLQLFKKNIWFKVRLKIVNVLV